jgi:hypothetical protein
MTVWQLSTGVAAQVNGQQPTSDPPQSVSIVELIANKREFDGKNVIVKGYLLVDFENCALYLSEESARKVVTKNGIWISLHDQNINLKKYNKKWIIIEGIFDAKNGGHLGLWSGEIRLIRIRANK